MPGGDHQPENTSISGRELRRDVIATRASSTSQADTTRATPPHDNKTITRHEAANPRRFYRRSGRVAPVLHPWELERWSPSSLEHPINKHPVFSQASEIELPRARAVLSRGEYFEVPPGDEAGVSHAHVHRALRGVPADGHRLFLHQILEFSAL